MTIYSHEVARIEFEAAREAANLIGRRYATAAIEFRTGRMTTDDYLIVRAERDAANLAYDLAEANLCKHEAELAAHNADMTELFARLEDER
jgi:hypothetical protein